MHVRVYVRASACVRACVCDIHRHAYPWACDSDVTCNLSIIHNIHKRQWSPSSPPSAWHRSCPSPTPDFWGRRGGTGWLMRTGTPLSKETAHQLFMSPVFLPAGRQGHTGSTESNPPADRRTTASGFIFTVIEERFFFFWREVSKFQKSYDSFAWRVTAFVRCFYV